MKKTPSSRKSLHGSAVIIKQPPLIQVSQEIVAIQDRNRKIDSEAKACQTRLENLREERQENVLRHAELQREHDKLAGLR